MERRYREVWVKGLLFDCPFGTPLDSCPVKDLRFLPLKERMEAADLMTEKQQDEIIVYHKICLQEREGEKPDIYGYPAGGL